MRFYTNVKTYGNRLLVREVDGPERRDIQVKYSPSLYLEQNTPSDDRGLYGEHLMKKDFKSPREMRDFINRYKEVEDFKVFGNKKAHAQFIYDEYPKDIKWDQSKVRVATIDIEVSSENGFPKPDVATEEILSIVLHDSFTDRVIVMGLKDFQPVEDKRVKYYKMKSEQHMLESFINLFSKMKPDVVTGWYVDFFDIPYLINRIENLFGEDSAKKLSPWNIIGTRRVKNNGVYEEVYDIVGISILDYRQLYEKYTYQNREEYTLGFILEVELGEDQGKVDYGDRTLHELYQEDFQLFIEYNIRDVTGVLDLDEKMKFIEVQLTMAYDSKLNYQEAMSPVNLWDNIIYNELYQSGIIPPLPLKSGRKDRKNEGAHVKPPQDGKHMYVISFDATSLYPSVLMALNLSPEKFRGMSTENVNVSRVLDKLVSPDAFQEGCSLAVNGAMFDQNGDGYFRKIVKKFFDDRKRAKKEMIDIQKILEADKTMDADERKKLEIRASSLDVYQMARKIALNSLYGGMSNKHFRFFDMRYAEAITITGQASILWVMKYVNEYLNNVLKTDGVDYIVAGDTDSLYVTIGDLVEKLGVEDTDKAIELCDRICKEKLSVVIDKSMKDFSNYLNLKKNVVVFKREAIARSAVWTAKKRYALDLYDDEGVRLSEPKIKVTGLEAVRSSTPLVCRTAIKEALMIVLRKNEDDYLEYMDDFRNSYKELEPEKIAAASSCNNLAKYSDEKNVFAKGCPQHVRGALFYNKIIKEKNLDKKYKAINEGEKVKYVFLKLPNPIMSDTISFQKKIPKEFGLDEYIDYDKQFEKNFTMPMKKILDVVNWRDDNYATLADFY